MYANIIVDISLEKLDKTFQYKIPDNLIEKVYPGVSVVVPFGNGNRKVAGIVLAVTEHTEFDESKIKDIISVNEKNIPIEATLINIAWFIKETYGSTMNQALKTVIPVKEVTTELTKKTVKLIADEEKIEEAMVVFKKKRATARIRLIDELVKSKALDYVLVTKKLGVSKDAINALCEMELIAIDEEKQYRNPIDFKELPPYDIELNEEQETVANDILTSEKMVHLIHGITGSGKTEVYMKIIEETINKGQQAIVLIPEIALTYQTVMRFYQKFRDRVSVINSKMSKGERYDQFRKAKNGDIDIIIGPRSAIFTPFNNLGLIVIDEEHENTYKSENVPKYHAREVAIYRAKKCGAKVVLGSATPSVESYYNCKKDRYVLHKLKNRAVAKSLPKVSIVDLRDELKKGNRSMFSFELQTLIKDRLAKKEQIMLFINRRGYAGFVSCRSCGKPIRCPHCDVGLNLHRNGNLVCHYCGFEKPMPKTCPECGSKYIAAFGTGTEKVEEAVKYAFKDARVLRMDADTTAKKDGHEKILQAFSNGEADILVGTQMIVKGHDFPNVTLVGVIAADLSLFSADFRSSERTFDLLTQAAGRAGRSEKPGNVVIQTYSPEEYSIILSAKQDYETFYEHELMYRSLNGYPPVINLMAIVITSDNQERCNSACEIISKMIDNVSSFENDGLDVEKRGPADCNINRINDIYRKVIYLKSYDIEDLKKIKNMIEKNRTEGVDEISVEILKKVTIQYDLNPMTSY